MRRLFIVPRQSLDWGNISLDEYRQRSPEFCAAAGYPPDMMNNLVDVWNRTFQLPYFKVRQRMKDIAHQNWERVGSSRIVTPDSLGDVTPDAWVAFVDDDDWFAPGLVSHLPSPATGAVIWRHVICGWPEHAALGVMPNDSHAYTNNYAVSGRTLNALPFSALYQHLAANEAFKRLSPVVLPDILTAANKHPACSMALQRAGASNSALVDSVQRYVSRMQSVTADGPLAWVGPYLRETLHVYASLVERQPLDPGRPSP